MKNRIPESILKKYPQLKNITEAIELFQETGNQKIKCDNCNSVIVVNEDNINGFLETNCLCGKSKYRMRWDPDKA